MECEDCGLEALPGHYLCADCIEDNRLLASPPVANVATERMTLQNILDYLLLLSSKPDLLAEEATLVVHLRDGDITLHKGELSKDDVAFLNSNGQEYRTLPIGSKQFWSEA